MGYWERVQNAYSPEGMFLFVLALLLLVYVKFLKKIRHEINDKLDVKDGLSDVCRLYTSPSLRVYA